MIFTYLRRLSVLGLVSVALILSFYLLETFWSVGELDPIEPGFVSRCKPIEGLAGPEDITIHPRSGVAYVAAYDRAEEAQGRPVRGAIYAYRPGSGKPPVELTRAFEADLRPHGISLWLAPEVKGGRRRDAPRDRLLAVNHGEAGHSVEIFEIAGDRLEHVETLRDPLFVSPSDLAAVGPRAFYLTNDTGTRPDQWAWYLENLWRFPFSNVVLHDGESAREVATGIAKASGISIGSDGRSVYVAAMMGRRIHLYARDPESGQLSVNGSIRLGTNPDNIEIDASGWLWVGAHPRLVTLVRHVLFGSEGVSIEVGGVRVWDASSLAPSQVVRIKPDASGAYELTQVFGDEGEQISASSVAARRDRRLLIGSLTDSHILDCAFDPFPRAYRRSADASR